MAGEGVFLLAGEVALNRKVVDFRKVTFFFCSIDFFDLLVASSGENCVDGSC